MPTITSNRLNLTTHSKNKREGRREIHQWNHKGGKLSHSSHFLFITRQASDCTFTKNGSLNEQERFWQKNLLHLLDTLSVLLIEKLHPSAHHQNLPYRTATVIRKRWCRWIIFRIPPKISLGQFILRHSSTGHAHTLPLVPYKTNWPHTSQENCKMDKPPFPSNTSTLNASQHKPTQPSHHHFSSSTAPGDEKFFMFYATVTK